MLIKFAKTLLGSLRYDTAMKSAKETKEKDTCVRGNQYKDRRVENCHGNYYDDAKGENVYEHYYEGLEEGGYENRGQYANPE